MTPSLKGQRVLVTAGAGGIGRVMVDRFVEADASVFACDVDDAALSRLEADHPAVGQCRCDVGDPAQVEAMMAAAEAHLGGLDALINNAGISGPAAPVEQIDLADWEQTLAVNITGQFLVTRLAVPTLRAAGGGAIVNLSSAAGKFGYPLRTPYAASKWAVVGFTKSLSAELGADGIRVNAILPGAVEGERIDTVIRAKAEARGVGFEEMKAQYVAFNSLKTLIPADDIAQMAVYLCSSAGRAISGQAISIDGDTQYLS